MTTRVRSAWLVVVIWVGTFASNMQTAVVEAANGNKACGLLTPSELEGVLGANVSLSGGGGMGMPVVELCTGQAPTATVMLRLVTGLDPGRDRSGAKEKAGIEMVKKIGAQVDVKTFGPITCSTIEPPANQAQMGFNTTCTVNKETAVAGIEVTAKSPKDQISIERLRPLAEKMAGRF